MSHPRVSFAAVPLPARAAAAADPVPLGGNRTLHYRVGKRLLDVAGAAALLVLLSPLMGAVLLLLAATTRGRPIFAQERLGAGGRPFRLYKFRTMTPGAEKLRHLVANELTWPAFKSRTDPRVTRIGHWLRRTSIDELPQLVNTLAGQMALVGPRPLACALSDMEPWQRDRLSVKPGLTCLWQVSGRSTIGFDEWARMDLWYVANQSLWTDLKLLARTPWAVLGGRGAY